MKTKLAAVLAGLFAVASASAYAAGGDQIANGRVEAAVDVVGIDHVGIVVPDMDQAIRFFSETFGFQLVTEMKNPPVDAAFKKLFNIHDSSKVKAIVMMRAKNGANVELFAFDAPAAVHDQPHYDDAGSAHIALYVDNIDEAVSKLRGLHLTVLTDPIRMTTGPTAGNAWAYFLTPWGAKMELVSYPNGQTGEVASSVHLWRASQGLASSSDVTLDQKAIYELVDGYIGMLNDPDPQSRMAFLTRHYTADTVFNDPEALVVGREPLNALVGRLQARNVGWKFKEISAPELQHGNVRVRWQYGPASSPAKIVGEDIVAIADGRVATTVVFLNKVSH